MRKIFARIGYKRRLGRNILISRLFSNVLYETNINKTRTSRNFHNSVYVTILGHGWSRNNYLWSWNHTPKDYNIINFPIKITHRWIILIHLGHVRVTVRSFRNIQCLYREIEKRNRLEHTCWYGEHFGRRPYFDEVNCAAAKDFIFNVSRLHCNVDACNGLPLIVQVCAQCGFWYAN